MDGKIARGVYVLLFLSGLGLCCLGFVDIIDARKCRSWDVVPGRIMDSSFVETSDIHKNRIGQTYIPDIKYEYSYAGTTQFNNQIGYFGKSLSGVSESFYEGTEADVVTMLSDYPVDLAVDVFVNPERPSQSVLDAGLKFPVFMPFLYGFFLILFSIHLYVFGCFYVTDNKSAGKLA
ncbi:MAG: DUF3592 domain-containing protein [Victivallales bacterium]|nr:DUF3592 domain-containing protein [Victivallales bacterium]